jgi:FtsP/CotA-like multicopper oxidase with cupredoxin domain
VAKAATAQCDDGVGTVDSPERSGTFQSCSNHSFASRLDNAGPNEQPLFAEGWRDRLVFDNQTDESHPVHLHRNSFELTNVYGKPTAGVMKDVVLVKGFRKIEVDVTPAMEGLTLFHCHQQLHMDYGRKMLFDAA